MTAYRFRGSARAPSPPDRLPPRRGGRSSPYTYAASGGGGRSLLRSARALAAAALLALAGALGLPTTAQAQTNAAPSFTSSTTFSVQENQVRVLTVEAEDSDMDDDVTGYEITGGGDETAFRISPLTGQLWLATVKNFENAKDRVSLIPANAAGNNQYVVVVTATSGTDTRVKTATQAITVTVRDVGREAPGKPDAPWVSAASVTSLTVSWTMPDNEGPAITDYDVRYRASGNWIDSDHTGPALTATLPSLMENTHYQVQVRATNDEDTGRWSASGSGTTDANAAPTFTSPGTFSVEENQTSVDTVEAEDSDMDDDVTGYEITGGVDQALFSIVSTSGVLTFDAAPNYESPRDRGANNTYEVAVQATSGTGMREKTATQTITVTVTDVAEKPPKPRKVAWGHESGGHDRLSAYWDPLGHGGGLLGQNGGLTIIGYDVEYRESPSGDWINVVYDYSDLYYVDPYHGHPGGRYRLTIYGLSSSKSYLLRVRTKNEEADGDWSDVAGPTGPHPPSPPTNDPPYFTSPDEFSLEENQTAVGTLEAEDSDVQDDTMIYSIHADAPNRDLFSIGAMSGALAFKTAPNYEKDAKGHRFKVQVTSGTGEREMTETQWIGVTVTDVDEKPPKPANPTLMKRAASPTTLRMRWPVSDLGGGPRPDSIHVQYRQGATGMWKTIPKIRGGALSTLITGLTAETEYQVRMQLETHEINSDWSDPSDAVSTDAESLSCELDTRDIWCGVLGVEDGFSSSTNTITIPKGYCGPDSGEIGTPIGELIGTKFAVDETTYTVSCIFWGRGHSSYPEWAEHLWIELDPMPESNTFRPWILKIGDDSFSFADDVEEIGTAGVVGAQVFRFPHAYATLQPPAIGSVVTVRLNVNAAPSFTSAVAFDAAENQTSAGTVTAADGDDDITGYAITGGVDQTLLSIGATSGALTFDAAPNYEDAKDRESFVPANDAGNNEYVVIVTATSGTGERVKTARRYFTVTVTDAPGEAPGKPNAPTVPAASVTSLTVNWAAPANAGPAITDYDVQYREGATGDWSDGNHTGAATTATLSGLSDGTSYQVRVRATNDEGTGSWSDSGTGTTDANAAPSFSSSATFNAAENQTTAGTVTATDSDSEDDIEGYALTGGADQTFFSIGATDGALTFKAAPNFEDAKDIVSVDPANAAGNNQYVVVVTATSGTDTRVKTATQTITVTVTDDDTEKPGTPAAPNVSAASVTSLTVNWSAPANAGPAITDYDVQYREGATGDWSDGNHTGAATTATLSGLSENTSHQVQVRATNAEGTGSWSDAGSGTTDANAAPSFSSSATFNAAENQTTAGTVTATDSDSEDDIEGYALTGGADQTFFSIGATDGALTFKAAPNFEDAKDIVSVDPANAAGNNQYVVVVTATSGTDTRVKTATQTITVTVTDDDTEKPGTPAAPNVSAASVTSLTVNWSAPANAGPAITDYDVQYREGTGGSWTDGNHTGTAVTATLSGLSENTSHQVQVRATNAEGTGSWSDSGSGTTDANAAPAFSSSATFDAAENQTTAGTVLATDSDSEDDITGYALTGGADQTFFSIGATDGALTFKAAPNFEDAKDIVSVDPANAAGNNQYVVVVTATSGTDTRVKTATQTITVTVTDDDTEKPGTPAAPNVSAASVTSLTVNWSAPANAGPAITDYDVQYRAGTSGSWTDGNHTGTAVTATLSGLSENTSHQVQVRATNAEGTGSWSDSGSGTTDANAAPAFSSSATFDAAENQTTAGTVLATDSDSEDDITGYALTGGADQTFFSIGATDGALTFKAAPNFEDAKDIVSVDPANAAGNNQYVVVVTATSGTDTRVKTATQTITVTVTDDDTEKPGTPAAPNVSAASVTSLTVNWSAPANAGPAITDYDVQYRAGTSGSWTDGNHTGTAVTATLSGLSENTSHQVQVRATNAEGTGSWSDSGSGTTDANAAPAFSSSATFDAAENQTTAGTVLATDSDSEDDITGYALTGGADQTFFSIGATDGALTFKAAPNFEDAKDIVSVDPANAAGNNQYVVVVTATSGTDTRVKTATQTITVTVTDDDTEKPGTPAAPNVSAASVTSLSVNWAAPDNAGPAIDDYDVQYRAGTSGDWSDAGHTGTATTATLTGLSENTSYQVQVRATNAEGTGAWSDSGSGATDANAAPAFSSSATFDAAENQTTVGTVLATDSDADDSVTGYEIGGGADQAFFSIGSTDGALTFDAAPNYEDAKDEGSNNTYVVEVTATSGAGEREKTATQTITVTVTDVAGEAPGKPGAPSVSAASASSLSVNWAAPDNAGPAIDDYDVQYREGTSGDWSDAGHTGTATTATLTGLSENTSYQVQVRATNDEGTGAWSDAGSGATAEAANAAPSPQDLQAEPVGGSSTSVTVTWSAPEGGSAITGYDVQYRAGASGNWSNWDHTGAATTATITGLEANTAYQVQVRALSAMGPSPWTALANVRTNTPPDADAPAISSLEVRSWPQRDGYEDVYGFGETIVFTVTFSEKVRVTGQPTLAFDLGGETREARFYGLTDTDYARGSAPPPPRPEGVKVHFGYRVEADDRDDDGVAVGANAIRPGGARIRSAATGVDADLSHAALGPQSDHKVDVGTTQPAAGSGVTIIDTDGNPLAGYRLVIRESAKGRYGLKLNTRPTHTVHLRGIQSDGDEDLRVLPTHTVLPIAPDEWETPIWMEIRAAPDDDAADGERIFLNRVHSRDPSYNDLILPDVLVVEEDDDEESLSVADAEATDSEDATLDGPPEDDDGPPEEDNVYHLHTVAVESEEPPDRVALMVNYPNPFNPSTGIAYELPEPGPVRLAVYDMIGREVRVLVDAHRTAGRHTVRFDAEGLPTGTYAYVLTAGSVAITRVMVLVR